MVKKRKISKRSKTRNKTWSKINKTRSKKNKKTVEMEKILVGTIDIDLDNRVKKGGVQKGGDGEFRTSDLPEILWKLFETLLSRGPGAPGGVQATRRALIRDALKEAFGMIYGDHARDNVVINLKMKSTPGIRDNTGLLIEFYMPPRRGHLLDRRGNYIRDRQGRRRRTGVHYWSEYLDRPFYPFHISLHDTPWGGDHPEFTPPIGSAGRWHSTGDSRGLGIFEDSTSSRMTTPGERNLFNNSTKARFQLEYKQCDIGERTSVRIRIRPNDIVFTAGGDPGTQNPLRDFLRLAITILNNNLFKHIVSQINPNEYMTRENVVVITSDHQWTGEYGDLDQVARSCNFDDEDALWGDIPTPSPTPSPDRDNADDGADDNSTGGTKRKTRKRKTRKRKTRKRKTRKRKT